MATPKSKAVRLQEMFDSYCHSTIDNAIAYYHRRGAINSERELIAEPEHMDSFPSSPSHAFHGPTPFVMDGFYCAVDDETLFQAFLALPKKELKVLVLDFWYLKKDSEIAKIMEVSVRTVYNLRQRAFKKIKHFYEERAP